ncbi:E3 ubiquitin-protein ligase TRIM39-like [Homarus americanus]|uniref:E3 ubiquitin-protein ligase TRIM39-like n=1 Tax=Homarus americanus TaxID=6706 RepID=A0A8J5JU89_HOMAM|nr:E3 ubiquitin-protein ligase TRIM39-like [Homarus americanus]
MNRVGVGEGGRARVMEELTCSVCSEMFEGGLREPVVLPQCGHTFCRPCLLNLQSMHNFQQESEACQSHGDPVRLWCRSCQESLCGQCLFERHMADAHHVIKIQEVVQEKKQTLERQTTELLDNVEEERASLAREVHGIAHHLAWVHTRSTTLTKHIKDVHRILKGVRKTTRMEAVLTNENSLESLSTQLGRGACDDVRGHADDVQAATNRPPTPLTVDYCNTSQTDPYYGTPGSHNENNNRHLDTNDNPKRSLKLVDKENNIRAPKSVVDEDCEVSTDEEDRGQRPHNR